MDSSNDEALDIIVTNVVATFRTRCHLNLRTIALEGTNVIYKPEAGVRRCLNVGVQKKNNLHTSSLTAQFFFISESPDEASQAQDNSLHLVLRENHLHWSNKVNISTHFNQELLGRLVTFLRKVGCTYLIVFSRKLTCVS